MEDKETIFLNDFRYSTIILTWSDMPLCSPKTVYNKVFKFNKDIPATTKALYISLQQKEEFLIIEKWCGQILGVSLKLEMLQSFWKLIADTW